MKDLLLMINLLELAILAEDEKLYNEILTKLKPFTA